MPDQWRGFCQPLSLCVTTRRLYQRTSDSEAIGILQVLQHSSKAAQSLIGLFSLYVICLARKEWILSEGRAYHSDHLQNFYIQSLTLNKNIKGIPRSSIKPPKSRIKENDRKRPRDDPDISDSRKRLQNNNG